MLKTNFPLADAIVVTVVVKISIKSSIHGFIHLSERNRSVFEIILWISLIGLGVYGTSRLSTITLTRYQENPTVISMERDRFAWNTTFPGATICPSYKFNEMLLDDYVRNSTAKNKTALREFLVSLAGATYDTFENVVPYDDISSEDYVKILRQFEFEFKPTVSNSGVKGLQYQLQKTITEIGVCYSFNSQLAVYNSPEYWDSNQKTILPPTNIFAVNPFDGEVFANVVNMSTGITMFLHGPHEVADVASKSLSSPNGFFLQIYIAALTLYSSERIRPLKISQRKCRFYDEGHLQRTPVYSFVLCRMECRANLAKKLCNCVPHFYRKIDGDITCDVKGMHCLAKHKERLITLKRECACVPNCEEVNYVVEHLDTREWFLGSNLQWGLKEYPRMRLKRDVIFGFADVLVYVGGMAGLFFGFSVLSLMEIVYYFTIHLFWFVIRKQASIR